LLVSPFLQGNILLPWASLLTIEKLKNAEYQTRRGNVKLTDGIFENNGVDFDFHSVERPDKVAFGDLNGDGIADAG
jgi:hypothetical protein